MQANAAAPAASSAGAQHAPAAFAQQPPGGPQQSDPRHAGDPELEDLGEDDCDEDGNDDELDDEDDDGLDDDDDDDLDDDDDDMDDDDEDDEELDGLARTPWSSQQKVALHKSVQTLLDDKTQTFSWVQVAQTVPGRSAKQCRERWASYLMSNSTVASEDTRNKKRACWTKKENEELLAAHHELGNKWVEIANRLDRRTGSSAKNQYYRLIRCLQLQSPWIIPTAAVS